MLDSIPNHYKINTYTIVPLINKYNVYKTELQAPSSGVLINYLALDFAALVVVTTRTVWRTCHLKNGFLAIKPIRTFSYNITVHRSYVMYNIIAKTR